MRSDARQRLCAVRLARRELLAAQPAVQQAAEQAADERRQPEQPELRQRAAAG
jgi:hypothetical protein